MSATHWLVTGMTGSARGARAGEADRVTLRVAELAGRLTERDRQLCRLLWEHRVLTSHQLTQLAFHHLDTAEDRLRTLTGLGVLDRFRPRRDTGSAPYHYVLGPLGAAMLATEQHSTVAELGYRRATALAVAHYQRLPEIVAVNSFFTALTAYARHHPDIELARWLSQRRCQAIWGTLVQPHGFGRWRDHDSVLEFFLHYAGQELTSQLIAVLAGYDALAQATPQLATNVLVWLTSPQRETELHRTVPPRPYLLATATQQPASNPADAIWLPLGSTGPRQPLADLPYLHRQPPDRP
jgi:Replication-relaxation